MNFFMPNFQVFSRGTTLRLSGVSLLQTYSVRRLIPFSIFYWKLNLFKKLTRALFNNAFSNFLTSSRVKNDWLNIHESISSLENLTIDLSFIQQYVISSKNNSFFYMALRTRTKI